MSKAAEHDRTAAVAEVRESPRNNLLLKALPDDAWESIKPYVELIDMPLGQVLYESGDKLRHVYFPSSCIVSLLYETTDGHSANIGIVGREGMVGISLLMGSETAPSRSVVQCAGTAYRLHSNDLKQAVREMGPMQQLLLSYAQALITDISQTVVCNGWHSIEQQLSRWLLTSMDRVASNELVIAQELIANDVRREDIIESARKLHELGLIRYNGDRITVLDRPALEARSCECYAVVKREFDRLLALDRGAVA